MTARQRRRITATHSLHGPPGALDDLVDVAALGWQNRALCAEVDPEIFFPEQEERTAFHAKKVCKSCPVRTECLEYALNTGQEHGVWGGVCSKERQKIKSNRRKGVQAA